MEIKIPVNEEMMKEKEVLVASLKKDEIVKAFLVSNQLDESFVEQFPYRIQKGLTNMKKCAGCSGLHECRQPQKGQVNALSYDGMLVLQPKLCAYASAYQSERAHLKKFWINQMPEHLKTVSIKQIDQSKESNDYLPAFAEVTLNLSQPEQGLYLCGAVGTGKTYLACCIANYFARKGQSVVFVQTPGWISKMKGMFNDPDGFERELEMMKKASVVILDDIGAESVTPWVRDELLFPILNERMENGRLTYFTSNEELSSLQDHYAYSSMGEEKMKAVRLMERIKMLSKPVEIQGKNRRFNK